MQNYQEGDRICLFGFSRGSYTARCLAGMIHKVGLLPADNQAQVCFAYKMYKDETPEGQKMSEEFKKTFCMNVTVYFIGIWDCVASVSRISASFDSNPCAGVDICFPITIEKMSYSLRTNSTDWTLQVGRLHSQATALLKISQEYHRSFPTRNGS